MEPKIFVNLAVKDLDRSVDFFTKVGYTFNPMFTDKTATCMVISEHIHVMLLTEEKFRSFTEKQIADTTKVQEALLSFSAESREAIDEINRKAMAAGAINPGPVEDYGYMYSQGFEDPDGHVWNYFWMDISQFPKL